MREHHSDQTSHFWMPSTDIVGISESDECLLADEFLLDSIRTEEHCAAIPDRSLHASVLLNPRTSDPDHEDDYDEDDEDWDDDDDDEEDEDWDEDEDDEDDEDEDWDDEDEDWDDEDEEDWDEDEDFEDDEDWDEDSDEEEPY